VEGSCEHGNEPSGSIKCWEILERVTASQGGLQLLGDSCSKRFNIYELKPGGLHEKHAEATWNFGTISAFA
jgi:hypothetical protein